MRVVGVIQHHVLLKLDLQPTLLPVAFLQSLASVATGLVSPIVLDAPKSIPTPSVFVQEFEELVGLFLGVVIPAAQSADNAIARLVDEIVTTAEGLLDILATVCLGHLLLLKI